MIISENVINLIYLDIQKEINNAMETCNWFSALYKKMSKKKYVGAVLIKEAMLTIKKQEVGTVAFDEEKDTFYVFGNNRLVKRNDYVGNRIMQIKIERKI